MHRGAVNARPGGECPGMRVEAGKGGQ
jgi:hypothetical protein